jgi:zinc protease
LPITKVTLPSGLLVLLREIHSAPIITQWIWYRVGSRDEIPGITGVSHWVEHMQFKGTPRFPNGVLDRAIARAGGVWNAFTFLDWTTYYETMPAGSIDLAMELEADRMVNSVFLPEEVDSERTVIISERQGNENEPMFQLAEEVQSAAFRVHPYHHEIIGDMADLLTINRENLYRHYRSYYIPNNAVLALAGDFDTRRMLERIQSLYANIPPGAAPLRYARPEPSQPGERRVSVEGPGETTYIQVAYRAPGAIQPDFFAYTALDSLLTGPSSLNMFGGGISNKTSRLYQALVETELAVSVSGGLAATIDPFLYTVTITVHPQNTVEAVMAAFDEQVQKLQEQPPTEDELARAMKQARALFAYGSESISNQGFWLGFTEMFAEYGWFLEYLDRLQEVGPADIQRIAQTYLRPQNRVIGIYQPTGQPAVSEIEEELQPKQEAA